MSIKFKLYFSSGLIGDFGWIFGEVDAGKHAWMPWAHITGSQAHPLNHGGDLLSV